MFSKSWEVHTYLKSREFNKVLKLVIVALGMIITTSFFDDDVSVEMIMKHFFLSANADDGCSANLPHAQGKVFYTLDEYLMHLEKISAQDRPYYQKSSPGQYKLMTGRGGNLLEPKFFSREELAEKFGFTK